MFIYVPKEICQDFPVQVKRNWTNICTCLQWTPPKQGKKLLLVLKLLQGRENR